MTTPRYHSDLIESGHYTFIYFVIRHEQAGVDTSCAEKLDVQVLKNQQIQYN